MKLDPILPTFFAHPTCPLVGVINTWSRHRHVSLWCSFGFKQFPQLFGCSFSTLFGSLTNCPFEGKFFLFGCGFPFKGSITLAYVFLDFSFYFIALSAFWLHIQRLVSMLTQKQRLCWSCREKQTVFLAKYLALK